MKTKFSPGFQTESLTVSQIMSINNFEWKQ